MRQNSSGEREILVKAPAGMRLGGTDTATTLEKIAKLSLG